MSLNLREKEEREEEEEDFWLLKWLLSFLTIGVKHTIT